jgi:hypothetical protein
MGGFIMPYKVVYEYNGKRDEVFFGDRCTEEDIIRRIQAMKEGGFKILRHYPVKNLLSREEKRITGSIY